MHSLHNMQPKRTAPKSPARGRFVVILPKAEHAQMKRKLALREPMMNFSEWVEGQMRRELLKKETKGN